jgi:hypothetical protein
MNSLAQAGLIRGDGTGGVRKLSAQHRKWQTRAKAAASPADLRHTVSLEQWQGLDPQVRDGLLDLGDETLT